MGYCPLPPSPPPKPTYQHSYQDPEADDYDPWKVMEEKLKAREETARLAASKKGKKLAHVVDRGWEYIYMETDGVREYITRKWVGEGTSASITSVEVPGEE